MLVVGLLVIDAVPQSAIWKEWAKGHEDTVRFMIHAKVPEAPALVGDPWCVSALLPLTFRPEWGSVELVRAELALMAAALEVGGGEDGLWFLLASETCVPVVPCAQLLDRLKGDPRSRVAYRVAASRFDAEAERAVRAPVPSGAMVKCDQWVLLARPDLERVVAKSDLWPAFARVKASDEWFVGTCLGLDGAIDVSALRKADTLARAARQHEDLYGRRPAAKKKGMPTVPGSFDTGVVLQGRTAYCVRSFPTDPSPEALVWCPGVVAAARAEGCITARKFPAPISVGAWHAAVDDAHDGPK